MVKKAAAPKKLPAWKTLERHPVSAEYADLSPASFAAYVANLKQYGIVGERQVMLYEGKVIDGWQFMRACRELDIKPKILTLKLPKGMSLEEWVSTVNDHRRHETQEKAMKRAAERRERARAAKEAGSSVREIAETEGVSIGQVQRDLEAASVSPDTPANDNGDSTTPSPSDNGAQATGGKGGSGKKPVFCDRCNRIAPGKGIKDCPQCKELRKPRRQTPAEEPEADKEETAPPTMEDIIKAKNSELEKWCRELMRFGETMPEDPWLADLDRRQAAIKKLENCCQTVRSAKCYCPCPMCKGDGCRKCFKTGRVTKAALDAMGVGKP